MEHNHKFSQVSSHNHKLGFDRNILEYQQHNTLVSSTQPKSEEVNEIDVSKDNTKPSQK